MEYNLADLWEAVVDAVPDRPALVCGARRLTYAEADARIDRLAAHLREQGVGPGDRIALYLHNGTEYLEGMLASFKLRAVPVNVNFRYVEDELAYLLRDSGARVVIAHREFAPKLAAIRDRVPVEHHLIVEDASGAAVPDELAAQGYEAALDRATPGRAAIERSADDLYILYTGGTTGMPKGVMWRHEDIFFGAFGGGDFNGERIRTPEEIADKARAGRLRCLPACPFMHGTAHWIAFTTLYSGGTVVISPDRGFDATRLWGIVAAERVNLLVIVGDAFARPLVDALDEGVSADAVAGCSVILSGGAILSPVVKRALVGHLPGTMVIDGYGASETGGQGRSVTVAGQDPTPVPRFRVGPQTTVLDEHLRPAAPGTIGLLARRGHIPLGYHGDPEKTAATFPTIDGVRWSVPGDHAVIEADGSITLLGRGSVSINTGGEKVYPEEVEAALKGHPAVFDALVVGAPDERWGERVVAVVALRAGHPATFAGIDEHVRTHVAGYKAPRAFVVVPTIRRSPSGKPDYRWGRTVAEDALARGEVLG
ncbi:MAG: acyl-CoA synthetase [Actinomycetes bacterium]